MVSVYFKPMENAKGRLARLEAAFKEVWYGNKPGKN